MVVGKLKITDTSQLPKIVTVLKNQGFKLTLGAYEKIGSLYIYEDGKVNPMPKNWGKYFDNHRLPEVTLNKILGTSPLGSLYERR